jgi:cation diffusion facilitator family transporter
MTQLSEKELVKEKKKIALLSIFLNLFLSLMKISIGLISGSASLVADGIHSLADFLTSLSVYFGIIIASLKVEDFPYGLYKAENLVSLLSAFAIFFAGYEILREVFIENKLRHIENLPLALTAVIITILLTFIFSRYEKKKGMELNSPSLIADAEHIKTDTMSSIIVLFGIIANYLGYPLIEKLIVLIIVGFIFHAGWEIMISAIRVLLDASVEKETLDKIKEIIEKEPKVIKVKSLQGRNSGSYKFIEAEIILNTTDLTEAHEIAHKIEDKIKREIPFIEKLIIHFEPPNTNYK